MHFLPRRLPRFLSATGALACAAMLAACGGSDGGTSRVRLLNASADLAQADLTIDTAKVATAVPALGLSAYDRRDDGAVSLQVRDAAGATVASSAGALKKDAHYTLIAYGPRGAMRTSLLEEEQTQPAAGQSRLMVLNLAPEAGPVDVFLTPADTPLASATPFAANVAAGVGSGFLIRDSGTYRLRVTGAGRRDDLRLDLPALALPSTQVATLVLRGSAGGVLVHGLLLPQRGESVRHDNPSARVRLVAALARGQVEGQVDGTPLLPGSPSPVVGGYQLIPAGTRALRATVNGDTVLPVSTTLQAGGDYTLLVRGTASAPTVDLLTDDNHLPAIDGEARLRLINGLGIPATLNFNYGPIVDAVRPGTSADAAVRATAGAQLTVSAVLSPSPLHVEQDFATQANSLYSIVMVGDDAAPRAIVRRER